MAVEAVHEGDFHLRIPDEHDGDDRLKAELYKAVSHKQNVNVMNILRNKTRHGPFQKIGLHNSTVLHSACFLENFVLANDLLDKAVEDASSEAELQSKLLKSTNFWGNTILHDAAASSESSDHKQGELFVKKLLEKAPLLIEARNHWGESPLITAVRHGSHPMYKLLISYISDNYDWHEHHDKFLKRFSDNMTVLHMAILTRQFHVALDIAEKYPEIRNAHDDDKKMTALQMLANCPTAFKSGAKLGPLEMLIYTIVSTNDQDLYAKGDFTRRSKIWCEIKKIRKLKKNNEVAIELANTLIASDFSFKCASMPLHNSCYYMEENKPSAGQGSKPENNIPQGVGKGKDSDEYALLLAAKNGCTEIVELILNKFPQVVDCLNSSQENLLHVATKNRNYESIFEIVEEKNLSKKGQSTAVDVDYNTIMHKVGESKMDEQVLLDTESKTPLQELSDELKLLEKLEYRCPDYLVNHRNKDDLTARELFAKTNVELRKSAKEYLTQTAEHCTVVTILIATVAFTAAYTVPGGPDDRTGLPVLLGKRLFLVFTITDVLSLGFGFTAVVFFLMILTSQFRMRDFQTSLPLKLRLGLILLFLSVTMMMVSFAATIMLTINTEKDWTKIALYIVAFFPVIIFMMHYTTPIYLELCQKLTNYLLRIHKKMERKDDSSIQIQIE